MMMDSTLGPSMALLLALGCGDSGAPSSGSGGAGSGGDAGGAQTTGGFTGEGGLGNPAERVGAFQIDLRAPSDDVVGGTTLSGKIYAATTPQSIIWEEALTEGDCVLRTPRVPVCSMSCGGSALCVEDETCETFPASQSAGVITATGFVTTEGAVPIELPPVVNTYQFPAGVELAYPPFEPGDALILVAKGGDVAPFEIQAFGVSPLELAADGALPMTAEEGLTLTWQPALVTPEGTTVYVKADISHHGGTKGMIECVTDDDGELQIGSAISAELLALGVSGFPTLIARRQNIGSTLIHEGRVDLAVTSTVERAIAIDGLLSCTDDVDCPEGKTCQTDLQCE